MKEQLLIKLASEQGTPLFIVDHEEIRENYRRFKEAFPAVQVYYAVKANSAMEIIKTLFDLGSSFDVASYEEFREVKSLVKDWDNKKRRDFIFNRVIYSNTIKRIETLGKIKTFRPLVTFDNQDEIIKLKEYCATARLVLRVKVSDKDSLSELNSKFGASPEEAVDLIQKAVDLGFSVEGISFHVGSQCVNVDNYVQALGMVENISRKAAKKGIEIKLVDIGGGFPVAYDSRAPQLKILAGVVNSEIRRLFNNRLKIIAEPGRFMVAISAALVTQIIGKSRRGGKRFYYINDGVYQTFSGVVFDRCQYHFQSFKKGRTEECAVVGQTCDGFDKISLSEELPGELNIGDYLFTRNIGAYSIVSSTNFNGFPQAKILHWNY